MKKKEGLPKKIRQIRRKPATKYNSKDFSILKTSNIILYEFSPLPFAMEKVFLDSSPKANIY